MILSICIPTFNRIDQLDNCLNSILIAKKNVNNFKFEVCISDNNSKQNPSGIIEKYKNELDIKFGRNEKNLGYALNAVKVVSMSQGEYSWLIGNDDLLMPDTLLYLKKLLNLNFDKDYFFVNSYHLDSGYLKKFSQPFDTKHLQNKKMKKISNLNEDRATVFWELIDPKVSWEFLTGIFLSIFRTRKWLDGAKLIDKEKISDTGVWATFENTFPHSIANANAYKNSKAYICTKPLSINLWGEREWGDLYEFVEIVRIPELLDYYRSQGLKLKDYLYCKNFALRNFSSYMVKIILGGKKKGRQYLKIKDHILKNLIFPNVYISFIRVILKKIIQLINFK